MPVYRASRPHLAVLGKDPGAGRWSDRKRHPDSAPASGIELVLARDVAGVRDLLATGEPTRIRTFPTIQEAVDALGRP